MNLSDYFNDVFTDYTLRTITLGTAILGVICGILGSFAVLKKQSLLGDAISHAALPGIAIAFLITGIKDTNILLLGALVSGLIGAYWVRGIIKNTHLKTDTALGITLSIFFGMGILLIGYIAKTGNANQSGLEDFIFGKAATLMQEDVFTMGFVLLVSIVFLLIYWKEIKLMLFDADYARTIGFETKKLDLVLTSLIVAAIVLGLKTVGVVLMSAMLLAPAAAARQWTNSLGVMVVLASIFGVTSGVLGSAISYSQTKLSTGPVIILISFVFVVISFLFSPSRGILINKIKMNKNRKDLKLFNTINVLITKLEMDNLLVDGSQLQSLTEIDHSSIKVLQKRNFLENSNGKFKLTDQAIIFSDRILNKQ